MAAASRAVLEALSALSHGEALAEVRAELARRSLADFVRGAWQVHHPGVQLRWNWHLDAICEHLEAVYRREILRLAIAVPPGLMKSLLLSVYGPAWVWASDPSRQFLCASASQVLAHRDAVRCQEVVNSRWYQDTFVPDWTWDDDQNAKGYYVNTARGFRVSRALGQRVIGLRGDHVQIDDPLDAKDAESGSAALQQHTDDFDRGWSDRLNDPSTSTITVIMQRLHSADLIGHVLDDPRWVYLCLPAEFVPERRCVTRLPWRDPRTERGEPLFAERLTPEFLAEQRQRRGPRGYAAAFQQLPSPDEGAIFRREWFVAGFYRSSELPPEFDLVIGSWDATLKKSRDSDYISGQTWGILGAHRYLLWRMRAKLELDGLISAVRDQQAWGLHNGYPLNGVLIEQVGMGTYITAAMADELEGLIAIERPQEPKAARARACVPILAAGQVHVPHPDECEWSEDFMRECLLFPAGRNDDEVDSMTQALLWAREFSAEPQVYAL